MNDDLNLLFTLTDGEQLFTVAKKISHGLNSEIGRIIDYWAEPENKEKLLELLPPHCKDGLKLVEVGLLFCIL